MPRCGGGRVTEVDTEAIDRTVVICIIIMARGSITVALITPESTDTASTASKTKTTRFTAARIRGHRQRHVVGRMSCGYDKVSSIGCLFFCIILWIVSLVRIIIGAMFIADIWNQRYVYTHNVSAHLDQFFLFIFICNFFQWLFYTQSQENCK